MQDLILENVKCLCKLFVISVLVIVKHISINNGKQAQRIIFIGLNSLTIHEFETFCPYKEHNIVGLQLKTFNSFD